MSKLSRWLHHGVRGNENRFKPVLEQLDERILPSLTPVGPYAGWPYSAVTKVEVTFPDHKSFVGSGAMVDSFHVLTAAHMLYNYQDGGWATSVTVIPDMYYGTEPYGTASGTTERIDSSWASWSQGHPDQTSSSVEDVGLVTLNRTIGQYTGWFGFGYNNNSGFYANGQFETAGYPASNGYSGQQMYYSIGRAIGEQGDDIVFYEGNITNIPGQSGSPLWSGNGIIYGVNSGYSGTSSSSLGYSARISQSVFGWLESALKSDRPPGSVVHIRSLAASTGGLAAGITAAFAQGGATASQGTVPLATGPGVRATDEFDGYGSYADNGDYGYAGYDNYAGYGSPSLNYGGNAVWGGLQGWGWGTLAGYAVGSILAPELTLPWMIWGGALGGAGGVYYNL